MDLTSSAEMNSACGKVLAEPKRLDGAARRISWASGKSGDCGLLQAQLQFGPPGLKPGLASP
ncbi:hypothetical protein, partial [Intestinimonas butyriciproducens]|uniref:hypothetical protein n=1 Tax=Intestinimonas butyriciproducens TaxID=1297617 RepID=UPI003992729D